MRYPSIPYPGGKARISKQIINLFPSEGRMFVDAFCGHGNVFWPATYLLKYERWWINDLNTAPLFWAIKEIGNTVEIPERSKEEYYRQWELYKTGDKRAIILEPYLCFGGGIYGSSGPGGKKSANAAGYTKTMRMCHGILHATNVQITALDYLEMHLENLTENDSLYVDPPYRQKPGEPPRTRAYKPGDVNHYQLVELLKRAKCRWVLSEFRDPLYIEAFGEPITIDVQLNSTNFGKKNGDLGKARRQECLYKNF